MRAGVTFQSDLLKEFDEIIETMGYSSRSKAIQDAVRMFVAERKLLQKDTKNEAGLLMMLYDHEARGLEGALTRIQHRFASIICASMHVHLSATDCMEAIAVKGNAAKIGELRDELATKKGVKLFKVMIFTASD